MSPTHKIEQLPFLVKISEKQVISSYHLFFSSVFDPSSSLFNNSSALFRFSSEPLPNTSIIDFFCSGLNALRPSPFFFADCNASIKGLGGVGVGEGGVAMVEPLGPG